MLGLHKTTISMLLAVILVGCAGQPTVRYERLTKNSNNTLDDSPRFNLAKSILLLNYEDPKDKSGLTVKSVPTESVSNIFLIRDASGWERKTKIQLTKFDNGGAKRLLALIVGRYEYALRGVCTHRLGGATTAMRCTSPCLFEG